MISLKERLTELLISNKLITEDQLGKRSRSRRKRAEGSATSSCA
jgi:hypothetical protein